jgi:hypothetical protein
MGWLAMAVIGGGSDGGPIKGMYVKASATKGFFGRPRRGLTLCRLATAHGAGRMPHGRRAAVNPAPNLPCMSERGSVMCNWRNGRGLGGLVGLMALVLAPALALAGNTQEESIMSTVPPGSTIQVSKDGRFEFVVAPTPDGHKVMIANGQADQPYDEIGSPIYQTNGQKDRMVYAAKSGDKCFYVEGGAPGNGYDDVGPATISPDTSQIFYAALNNGNWCPIINAQIGQPSDNIGTPTFSPNSKRLAYPICNGNIWTLIDDNVQDPPCDAIGVVVYSPDSKHMAYDSVQAGKHIITIDGRPGPAFDAILPGTPFYTTDSLRCVYCGQNAGKWSFVVNNIPQQIGQFDSISVPMYKSDNKHYMFTASIPWPAPLPAAADPGQPAAPAAAAPTTQPPHPNEAQVVVYDGSAGQPYDAIAPESLHFNPDVNNANGPQYIYQATQAGMPITVLERFPGPTFDAIVPSTVNFTPDGAHTYYWAQLAGKWLWRNDRHTVDTYDAYKMGAAPYSVDGKRSMYAAKSAASNGQWQVFIDGNALPILFDDVDETEMYFTPDTRHTIFVAKSGGAWKVVVDGIPGPDYTEIVKSGGPVVQVAGTTLIYYAIKADGSFNRVTYTF